MTEWRKTVDPYGNILWIWDEPFYCEQCQREHDKRTIQGAKDGDGWVYYTHRGPHMTTHSTPEEARAEGEK